MIDVSQLGGVPETLLIPLMGRALETQKSNGILSDPKSLEIFERLDYNFEKFYDSHSQRSILRTTIRTAIIDQMVTEFLTHHPHATVVEIGCGLNSRFERLDNGTVAWFDLDVPEVYDVWKKFFKETGRRSFLPFSAFDQAWVEQVKQKSSDPCFFIAEASVIYFPEKNIRKLFNILHHHFPGSHYLFDSAKPSFLQSLDNNNDALKYFNATIKWTIDNIAHIKKWIPQITILNVVDLENPDPEFQYLYPDSFQQDTDGYQLNLIRF